MTDSTLRDDKRRPRPGLRRLPREGPALADPTERRILLLGMLLGRYDKDRVARAELENLLERHERALALLVLAWGSPSPKQRAEEDALADQVERIAATMSSRLAAEQRAYLDSLVQKARPNFRPLVYTWLTEDQREVVEQYEALTGFPASRVMSRRDRRLRRFAHFRGRLLSLEPDQVLELLSTKRRPHLHALAEDLTALARRTGIVQIANWPQLLLFPLALCASLPENAPPRFSQAPLYGPGHLTEVAFGPFVWLPEMEPWSSLEQNVLRSMEKERNEFLRAEQSKGRQLLDTAPSLKDHIEWLYLRIWPDPATGQTRSWEQIAGMVSYSRDAVSKAVRALASEIGITLPPWPSGGRPRKKV